VLQVDGVLEELLVKEWFDPLAADVINDTLGSETHGILIEFQQQWIVAGVAWRHAN
jgi:hypothetical protein